MNGVSLMVRELIFVRLLKPGRLPAPERGSENANSYTAVRERDSGRPEARGNIFGTSGPTLGPGPFLRS